METKPFILSPSIISDIYDSGVSTFSIPDEVTDILELISADWLKFVKEPVAFKKLFVVGHERGWVGRNGEAKKDDEGHHDIKEFFHFHADFMKRFNRKSHQAGKKYHSLFQNLATLHKFCLSTSLEIAGQFDRRFIGRNLVSKMRESTSNFEHVVRLLYYPARPLASKDKEKKDGFAEAHFDRDLFTFSLLENLPGLRWGPELEHPHNYQRNKVLVFPGTKFDYLTNGILKVVNHGVINSMTGDRIAIVFFSHYPLDKETVQRYAKKRREDMEKEIKRMKRRKKY